MTTRRDAAMRARLERGARLGDRAFAVALTLLGAAALVVAGVVVVVLARAARPTIATTGLGPFLTGREWDPVAGTFGALPFVYGTLVTSLLAVVLAVPVALGLSIFVVELAGPRLRRGLVFAVELLAAVPSVVYGLWGLLVLVPFLRTTVEPALQGAFGRAAIFSGPPLGVGLLAAGVLLAVMIIPTVATVAIEVLRAVPASLREGALALGATRWEMVRIAVLPFARRGLLGGALLGLARALGETLAVTMVIGNQAEIRGSLFAPGYSIPAVIMNELAEAAPRHQGALAGLALVLLGVTLGLSVLARAVARVSGPREVVA